MLELFRRIDHPWRTLARVQGCYYVVSGIWPLLHIDSFQAVTGPKSDLWLVYTVGALITMIGGALVAGARAPALETTLRVLATGSCLVLATVDIVFTARRIIGPIYLLDGVVELCLGGLWIGLKTDGDAGDGRNWAMAGSRYQCRTELPSSRP